MASDNQDRGRKPRSYYVDYTKHGNNRRRGITTGFSNKSRYKDTPDVSFGQRGFLITSVDEVKSYLEMRNIFEEYFEDLYSPEETREDDPKTIDDEIETQLDRLRKNRPFKQVKTHCRNTLFLNIMNEFSNVDPIEIVDKFFNNMAEKREMRCSNTFKVLPILDTFRNSVACAKESIANLLESKFKEDKGPKKYFIEFQSRGNYKMNPEDKQKMIEGVADTFTELRPDWSVDRENSDYMIVLVALKNVCCVTFLRDYFKRNKYNVVEFCKDFAPQSSESHVGPKDDQPCEAEEEKLGGDKCAEVEKED